jgi:hypothetical protein
VGAGGGAAAPPARNGAPSGPSMPLTWTTLSTCICGWRHTGGGCRGTSWRSIWRCAAEACTRRFLQQLFTWAAAAGAVEHEPCVALLQVRSV